MYTHSNYSGREVDFVEQLNFPKCLKCGSGNLVPLSDFGSQGASILYKAWVCTNLIAAITSKSGTVISISMNLS